MTGAVLATSRKLMTLTDGTVRLQVDIEPGDAITAMTLFGSPGTPIALAVLNPEHTARIAQEHTIVDEAGKKAQALHRCGFFKTPQVANAVGSDPLFQKWVRTQPCVITGDTQQIEYAHVRRVARGAGTGIKPKFSGVSLQRLIHRLQHQCGEAYVYTEYVKEGRSETGDYLVETARQWFEKKADELLFAWTKMRLLDKFAVESTRDLDFNKLIDWAKEQNIESFLPRELRANP